MTPTKEAIEAFEEIGKILLWPRDLRSRFPNPKHPDYFSVLEAIQKAIDKRLDPIRDILEQFPYTSGIDYLINDIEAMLYPEPFPLPDHIRAIGWVEAHKIKAEDTPA